MLKTVTHHVNRNIKAGPGATVFERVGSSTLDKVDTGIGLAAMIPLGLGILSRPFAWAYKNTGWKVLGKAHRALAVDRSQMVLSEYGGKVTGAFVEHAPSGLVSGFASAGTRAEEVATRVGIGGGSIERGLNRVGGKGLLGWLGKLNMKGAESHLEVDVKGGFQSLSENFSKSALSSHSEASSLVDRFKALESRMGSVDAVHGNYDALRTEMLDVHKGLRSLSKTIDPKLYGELNATQRSVNHLIDQTSNIVNKTQKVRDLEGGLGTYIAGSGEKMSGILGRYGKTMSMPRLLMNGSQAVFTAFNVRRDIKDSKKDFDDLTLLDQEMYGVGRSTKQMLSSKELAPEVVNIRKELRGSAANGVIKSIGAVAGQLLFLKAGGSMKGMMLAGMVQMGGDQLTDAMIQKSPAMKEMREMRDTLGKGGKIADKQYINLFAMIDPKGKSGTERSGFYGNTKIRADYLAVYAEGKQMKPGEAVKLASQAGSDPAFAAQITAEVDGMLAAKKSKAALTGGTKDVAVQGLANQTPEQTLAASMKDAAEINPGAKSNFVANLQNRGAPVRGRQGALA